MSSFKRGNMHHLNHINHLQGVWASYLIPVYKQWSSLLPGYWKMEVENKWSHWKFEEEAMKRIKKDSSVHYQVPQHQLLTGQTIEWIKCVSWEFPWQLWTYRHFHTNFAFILLHRMFGWWVYLCKRQVHFFEQNLWRNQWLWRPKRWTVL